MTRSKSEHFAITRLDTLPLSYRRLIETWSLLNNMLLTETPKLGNDNSSSVCEIVALDFTRGANSYHFTQMF